MNWAIIKFSLFPRLRHLTPKMRILLLIDETRLIYIGEDKKNIFESKSLKATK